VIYEELTRGTLNDESRKKYVKIIKGLTEQGAEGVVLGCTEIPLLIKDKDCDVPLFDTTLIHAEKALKYAVA
jgi:aspartate racemase